MHGQQQRNTQSEVKYSSRLPEKKRKVTYCKELQQKQDKLPRAQTLRQTWQTHNHRVTRLEAVAQDVAVLKQEPPLPLSHPLSVHRQYRIQLTEGRGRGLWYIIVTDGHLSTCCEETLHDVKLYQSMSDIFFHETDHIIIICIYTRGVLSTCTSYSDQSFKLCSNLRHTITWTKCKDKSPVHQSNRQKQSYILSSLAVNSCFQHFTGNCNFYHKFLPT